MNNGGVRVVVGVRDVVVGFNAHALKQIGQGVACVGQLDAKCQAIGAEVKYIVNPA